MKTLFSAMVLLMAIKAQAQFISTRYSYIHNETHAQLELMKVNQEAQTAKYYDQVTGESKIISLSEVSPETNDEIDGVRAGNMVLVKFSETTLKACEVWNLYTNGLSHVGCQTGKIRENDLIPRPILGTYTASTESMIKEVSSLDGFEKKDKVRLMRDIGDLKTQDLVRIEHIFANGSAMVQKMGFNLIDTSSLLMKSHVQIVELKDLTLNK